MNIASITTFISPLVSSIFRSGKEELRPSFRISVFHFQRAGEKASKLASSAQKNPFYHPSNGMLYLPGSTGSYLLWCTARLAGLFQ